MIRMPVSRCSMERLIVSVTVVALLISPASLGRVLADEAATYSVSLETRGGLTGALTDIVLGTSELQLTVRGRTMTFSTEGVKQCSDTLLLAKAIRPESNSAPATNPPHPAAADATFYTFELRRADSAGTTISKAAWYDTQRPDGARAAVVKELRRCVLAAAGDAR